MLLGDTGEVGASCLRILAADRNILFNAGMPANHRNPDALPYLDLLNSTSAQCQSLKAIRLGFVVYLGGQR